ncbi:MAG: hypothetical protein ABSG67_00765 [Thermoguttaceae bacterium]|jgi:hypothetical protein
MPKTLPAIVAVAVIAFSIGFNTARYPIVWEMVGASARLAEESGGTEAAAAPQPAKTDELTASIPSDNPALTPSAETQGPAAILPDQAIAVKTEPAGAESSPAFVPLVPVPGYLFNDNGLQDGGQNTGVRRLPPVYEEAPIPAGRYAAEYPQAPVTIYPSTGVE